MKSPVVSSLRLICRASQVETLLAGAVDGDVVAGIGVAHDAGGRVVVQHAGEAAVGVVGTVADDHHAGVLGEAHADAAAVVQRHPGGAGGGVEQGVEQRPVGDGIRAVAHGFGLAVGRGDRAAIEMVAADDDRRLDDALPDQIVEGEAEPGAIAEADPADARRQTLEGDALGRHVEPGVQMGVVGDQLLHLGVGGGDVGRIAGESGPAEGTDAAAEQRPDIGRHEAGEGEGVGLAGVEGALADVLP